MAGGEQPMNSDSNNSAGCPSPEHPVFPGEGWAAKYLRDCHGNHEQAIRKYLDFVAEFIALHR